MALFVAGSGAVGAQTPKSDPLTQRLTSQRAALEQSTGLPEEQKQQAADRIDEVQGLLDESVRLSQQYEDLQVQIGAAPESLARLRADKPQSALQLRREDLDAWTMAQLEVVLSDREQRLNETRDELAAKDQALAGLLDAARNGGAELAALEKRLAESSLNAGVAPTNGKEELAELERLRAEARRRNLKARIALLKLRQGNLNLLTEVAQLDRNRVNAAVETMQDHVADFRAYVQERRRTGAEAVRQAADAAVSGAPEVLRELNKTLSDLAEEQAERLVDEAELDRWNDRVKRRLDELKHDQERVERIVELGGATAEVSGLLQKRRALVPSSKQLTQRVLEFQQQLSDAALRQLEIDEMLRQANDSVARQRLLDEVLRDAGSGPQTRQQVEEVWSRFGELTLESWKTYTRYIGKLSELEGNTRQLLEVSVTYRNFIDDHLLWMPSAENIPIRDLGLLLNGVQWLVATENLGLLSRDLLALGSESRGKAISWVIGLVILLVLRSKAKRGLLAAAERTQKVRTDSFQATLKALMYTLVLILPWPWLLVGGGLLLGDLGSASEYTAVLAAGLQSSGHTLLLLQTLRHLCRARGLARVHLAWSPTLCDQLSRQVAWLRPFAGPLAFFWAAGAAAVPSVFIHLNAVPQADHPGVLALGRLAVFALMLLLAFSIHRVWRKQGPVMSALALTEENSKWAHYHLLWFFPALLAPLGLALAASSGYYYTTTFLAAKGGETLWFVLLLVFFKDLLLRGLQVTQRRLRFAEALKYRESVQQKALQEGAAPEAAIARESAAATEAGALPLDEEKADYSHLSAQVRQLVRMGYTIALLAGIWWIWIDVVPAFSFLDRIELPISKTELVDGLSQEVPLTLGDMVAGLLLGGLALFAARNIPALLELTLLQRLPLSRASRYAFTTLTQYVVAMVGLVITFKALGLQWSSIQWLVAALSVGLGFGLQEIVANFISGIILLFEQPIRVGDVVTVENTTGTVSRIRIRATTIVNWERQELVIPNKSFITGQLINWTLSDTVNRVMINVGVSYDTDTRKAMELMSQVAEEHPKVITDPPPRISFEGFGDNALTLFMRAYLNEVDSRLQTITELHQAILDKFREAGIEISFPQRDIHLDTSNPLELVLHRGAPGGAGA